MKATLVLFIAAPLFAQVTNVVLQGTSPTQGVISFTVPDPTNCLVQVSRSSNFAAYVDDVNTTLFPGSQNCNRAGSIVNGTSITFVIGLRTSQPGSDGKMHSRALKANTTHYYRIVASGVPDPGSPRNFTTRNLPLGAMYPEPPPFDPTLTAFGNYAWPEFDWSDPTKSVIEPLTGLEIKPFTRPAMRADWTSNQTFSTPYDKNAAWTSAGNAATNGASFATTAGAPTDYLFLPIPWFKSDTGNRIAGWDAMWGLDDILIRPYGSASVVDGTHNVVSLCLTIDSGQTCASSSFNVTLTAVSGATALVPAPAPAPVFKNWNLVARQGQKAPVTGYVAVVGSVATLQSPAFGQYFDNSTAPGSKVFITGSSSMLPTPCVNNMCTIASVQSESKFTIVESCATSGCPTNAFTAAAFGLRVAKTVATGSLSVSFGFDRASSAMSDAGVNGAKDYCNQNTVTVTVDRTGAALTQNLTGYICSAGGSDLELLIPSNADGTPRGEVRLLSTLQTSGFTSNGATVGGVTFYIPGAFDPTDPVAFYSATDISGKRLIFKGIYDTTKTDDTGRPCDFREWPAGGTTALYQNTLRTDCVTWTNLTNPTSSPSRDMLTQMINGYHTGVNAVGATVTLTPNPTLDMSFLSLSPYTYLGGGLITVGMNNGPNQNSDGLEVIGTFDLATGLLKHIVDTWSQLPFRWTNCHGCFGFTQGTWRSGGINILTDQSNTTHALNGGWQANVKQVSRTNAGVTPVWDNNTALAYNEGYTCPTFAQSLIDLGGSGANCILVKVSSEACSHQPASGANFLFADGKTEVQEFPCTTNVAGTPTVPSTTGANTWSKLQDTAVGDWLQDKSFSYLGGTERFTIASKTINAANDIDMWLIRWVGCRGAKFPAGLTFDTGGGACYPTAGNPGISTHANGWSYWMTTPFSHGGADGAALGIIDPTSVTTPWRVGNYLLTLSHGGTGASPTDGNITSYTVNQSGYYAIQYDQTFVSTIYTAIPAGSVNSNPGFAGKTCGGDGNCGPELQNYGSLTQYKAPPAERKWGLDYRHLNGAPGNGAEIPDNKLGNGIVTYSITPQGGTAQTYQLATNASGQDSLSFGTPDPKRLPLVGTAGHYLLKDYSSAATGNVFGDAQNFGMCRAAKINECRTGSTVGQLFVSVPNATVGPSCLVNQYEASAPCVFINAPATAQIMQFDLSQPDTNGTHQRRLGYGLAGPQRQYEFSNARMTPGGKYMIFPGMWVDGQRRELMMAQMPPFPSLDGYDRTGFISQPVVLGADANPNARIRFGYAENGTPAQLYCTSRQESCSTEIPSGAPADPYAFVGEARTLVSCAGGCTIKIPAISDRVVYYVVDRLDSGGAVVSSSAISAISVSSLPGSGPTPPPSIATPTVRINVQGRGVIVR